MQPVDRELLVKVLGEQYNSVWDSSGSKHGIKVNTSSECGLLRLVWFRKVHFHEPLIKL